METLVCKCFFWDTQIMRLKKSISNSTRLVLDILGINGQLLFVGMSNNIFVGMSLTMSVEVGGCIWRWLSFSQSILRKNTWLWMSAGPLGPLPRRLPGLRIRNCKHIPNIVGQWVQKIRPERDSNRTPRRIENKEDNVEKSPETSMKVLEQKRKNSRTKILHRIFTIIFSNFVGEQLKTANPLTFKAIGVMKYYAIWNNIPLNKVLKVK